MDRMTSMTAFVKVVDVGGFAAAARKLDISPSMVTTHVRALEERLGVRLLNRSTRRISLTEVGQAYYERCLQILADVEDAENVASTLLPDILSYDPREPVRYPHNGRTLTDDVVDHFFSIYKNAKVTDKVGPHGDLLGEFPYLGPPHNVVKQL